MKIFSKLNDVQIINSQVPYIPIWCRSPNKFIRYTEEDFDDGYGHLGVIITAIYRDKNNKEKNMVARVKWR